MTVCNPAGRFTEAPSLRKHQGRTSRTGSSRERKCGTAAGLVAGKMWSSELWSEVVVVAQGFFTSAFTHGHGHIPPICRLARFAPAHAIGGYRTTKFCHIATPALRRADVVLRLRFFTVVRSRSPLCEVIHPPIYTHCQMITMCERHEAPVGGDRLRHSQQRPRKSRCAELDRLNFSSFRTIRP